MYLQNYSCISYISDMDRVSASGRTNNDSLNRTRSSLAQTQTCFVTTHLCRKLPANSRVLTWTLLYWEVQFRDKFTFLKEIESKCLLFHILFYKQIFANFLNVKMWQFPEKLSVTTLPKRAAVQWQEAMNLLKSTNTHSLSQPASRLHDTPREGSAGTFPSAGYSTQSKGSGRGHSPASESWSPVSAADTHLEWTLCERVAYRPSQATATQDT